MMVSCGIPTCCVNIDILSLAFVELRQSMACIGLKGAVPERHGSVAGTYTYSEKIRAYISVFMLFILTVACCGYFVFRHRFDMVALKSPDLLSGVKPSMNQTFRT
jgi:hypothetical protein